MNESLTQNKYAKWKRPLISGLLSALLAGTCTGLVVFSNILANSILVLYLVALAFALPATFIIFPFDLDNYIVIATFLVWFLIGATIAYFTRKNKVAIGIWLLLLLISMFFSFMMASSIGGWL